jgi:hypothetical protein
MPDPASPIPDEEPGADRRAAVRQRFDWDDVTCELTSYGVSERWTAKVRDISAEGLGLVLDHAFESGTILEVDLASRDGALAYTVVARVSHSRPLADGQWLAGCSFVGKVSDDELRDIL